jgi:hypothetical protein
MQNSDMRTTIKLDDEVYEVALLYARARDLSLGAALSELVRDSRAISADPTPSRIETAASGLPIVRSRGRRLTPEMVKEAQEDDFE